MFVWGTVKKEYAHRQDYKAYNVSFVTLPIISNENLLYSFT